MENITFELSSLHRFGTAFFDYLALRKSFFVDNLGWDIPHNETWEMDQYDNPLAHYSLVLRAGRVVGGARVMATSAVWGAHTYMLGDAMQGKLVDIPASVMGENMARETLWECTRLVISDEVATHSERSQCLSLIVDGLASEASDHGAERLLSLSPLALMRALRQLGYDAERLGEPYHNVGDGRKYAVLSMPAGRTVPTRPVVVPTHRPQQPMPLHAPSRA